MYVYKLYVVFFLYSVYFFGVSYMYRVCLCNEVLFLWNMWCGYSYLLGCWGIFCFRLWLYD